MVLGLWGSVGLRIGGPQSWGVISAANPEELSEGLARGASSYCQVPLTYWGTFFPRQVELNRRVGCHG